MRGLEQSAIPGFRASQLGVRPMVFREVRYRQPRAVRGATGGGLEDAVQPHPPDRAVLRDQRRFAEFPRGSGKDPFQETPDGSPVGRRKKRQQTAPLKAGTFQTEECCTHPVRRKDRSLLVHGQESNRREFVEVHGARQRRRLLAGGDAETRFRGFGQGLLGDRCGLVDCQCRPRLRDLLQFASGLDLASDPLRRPIVCGGRKRFPPFGGPSGAGGWAFHLQRG